MFRVNELRVLPPVAGLVLQKLKL